MESLMGQRVKQDMTTHASCSHHARIFHAPRVYSPTHHRENTRPPTYAPRYSDRGSGRRLRHDCHQSRWDCRHRDSDPTRISLLSKRSAHKVQRPARSWKLPMIGLAVDLWALGLNVQVGLWVLASDRL